MHVINELLREYPLLSVLQLMMTIGMLVDAYRRGVEYWWFFLIFWLQPVGTWVYFFAIFLPESVNAQSRSNERMSKLVRNSSCRRVTASAARANAAPSNGSGTTRLVT